MAQQPENCLSNLKIYLFLLITIFLSVHANTNTQVHRRFEYKYSFKPPYLSQKDGTVPFWEYGGSKYQLEKIYF